jgi:hypothetical protein
MARAAAWHAAKNSATAYYEAGKIYLSAPQAVQAPVTGIPAGEPYGGERSTWVGIGSTPVVIDLGAPVWPPAGNGAPTITLLGDNPMAVSLNETFVDPGATAFDPKDGDISASIVTAGTVDTAVAGTYTITYNVTDSDGNAAVEQVRTVAVTAGEVKTLEVRVAARTDDVEELSNGWLYTNSSDLELTEDSSVQTIGLRFAGIDIPAGATIVNAWIRFTTDETGSSGTNLTVRGHDAGNARTFSGTRGVTSRPTTAAAVAWTPPAWTTTGASGADQQTPDLSAIAQAIVDRTDWAPGNAMAFVIGGTGKRVAESYDGSRSQAPLLHIEYTTGTPPPVNTAPVVAAAGAPVAAGATATLDGTVTDDGLPNATLTYQWAQTDGPETVTITNADQVDATALLPAAGDYTFTLTASDGELTNTATVTITATPAPPVSEVKTVETRIGSRYDDVEELANGWVYTGSSDLELGEDRNPQTVGLRFGGVDVPAGATIVRAWVQFTADEATYTTTSLRIAAVDAGDTGRFGGWRGVTSLPTVGTTAAWVPAAWPTVGAAGPDQQTPDLTALVQAVVDRADWTSGNALAFVIGGSGKRVADSYEGGSSRAPLLHIEYTTGAPPAPAGGGPVIELTGANPYAVSTGVPYVDPGASAYDPEDGPLAVATDESAVDTNIAGTYQVIYSATDSAGNTATAVRTVIVADGAAPSSEAKTLEVRIGSRYDDVEELSGGWVYDNSSDLELTEDWGPQTIGLRFVDIDIPAGATIVRAWVQFTADEATATGTSLSITAVDTGNVARFGGWRGVTGLTKVPASVPWAPPTWGTVGASGFDQQTPDLAALVQYIVNRSDWSAGNALALVITGTGRRVAESYEGGAGRAPLLHIEYTAP